MRVAIRGLLCLLAATAGCGGGDSNDPGDPFPDAAGVYEVSGGFDGIPIADGSFSGTLELNQTSQESGTLTGSAALLGEIDGELYNLTDDQLSGATVSPSGVITFTMGNGLATWTFSGTLAGNSISQGRHTLSDGDVSISGNWQGSRVSAGVVAHITGELLTLREMVHRLVP